MPCSFNLFEKPRDKGGLGVINILNWNVAAFSTHFNYVLSSQGSIWVSWVWTHRIGSKDFWSVKVPQICNWTWRKLFGLRTTFLNLIVTRLAASFEVKFWHDPWVAPRLSLTTLLSHQQILQTGIPYAAKASDFINQGNL